jgi:capsular exopolysaccharide synthesis family protein
MVPLLNISQGSVVDYVTQKPFSALAEALRAIRNAIHLANVDKPAKTVMVTSSLPSEGKSSFSASIGRLAAAAGTKTLLIDADLRRPSLAKLFSGLEREIKLEDLLQNDTAPKEAIAVDPETNLHILFAHGKTPLTAELLGSLRMQQLLDQLSQEFELILIDTPPIMGISDGWKLARHIDSLVYLVEWAETPRETVQTALRQLEVIGISPTGLVLSKVNMRQQQQYGYGGYGYYYSKYQNYYHN